MGIDFADGLLDSNHEIVSDFHDSNLNIGFGAINSSAANKNMYI